MNIALRAGIAKAIAPNQWDAKTRENNVQHTNYTGKNNRFLVDKNYASLQVRPTNVTFKGLPVPVGNPSVGEKVTALFEILKSNEVILVGTGVIKSMKDMEKHIDNIDKIKTNSPFKKVIKKIFFIQDNSIEQTMAFSKNQGVNEYTNLSNDMTFIKAGKKRDQFFIKPNDTVYVKNTDILTTKGDKGKLVFNANTKVIPNSVKEKYAIIIDFTEESEQKIQRINKMNLKEYTQDYNNQAKILTFKDVGGMNNAIQEIKEMIVYPIKHPEIKSKKNMNKAILLEGPPGTGKSLLGEATANESGAFFRSIKASELESKYVGESEANVRAVIEEARENQPAIIFIDEIDAIAKQRTGKDIYGDKTLNTWLAEISESEKRGDNIYFIAATNNHEALDTAMTRAGRFGKVIHVGEPDLEGTKHIFEIHRKGVPFDEKFNVEKYENELHKNNAVGADIAAAVEDAERFAKRRERIFEKIEEGTYKSEDMENLRVKDEDFDKAIEELKNRKNLQSSSRKRNQIGFYSDIYKK